MTTFLLIRHATNDTVGKRIAGRTAGVHLNDEGRQQSIQLAERLKHLNISGIYSSPLVRAVETAAPLATQLNLEIKIHEGLLEIDFGEWNNKTMEELKRIPMFDQFNKDRNGIRIPGGELMCEAQQRILNCMASLYKAHQQQTIALFSHADMIKAAVLHFIGSDLNKYHSIEISPASVTIVRMYDDDAQLLLMNHTGSINL